MTNETDGEYLDRPVDRVEMNAAWDARSSTSRLPEAERLGGNGMTYPVAFFHVITNHENGNAVGGMLISDNTGVPLEFVITNAVRPTPAQKILYGKRLKSFIAIELCGRQLLQQLKTKPSVIFVEDVPMLALSTITQVPVLQLTVAEQFGTALPHPTVVSPPAHPEYLDRIDIRSLDSDMLDGFRRIEQCREILAKTREEYQL